MWQSYYFSDFSCKKCPRNCIECKLENSKVICLKCSSTDFMYENNCLKECTNGILHEFYNAELNRVECRLCNNTIPSCNKCLSNVITP